MARSCDTPAYAPNWRQVIIADAAVGVVGVIAGLAVLFALNSVVIGAGLAALGAVYLVAVVRRALRWRRLRSDAGL